MQLSQKTINRIRANGSFDRLKQLLSASHMLFGEAYRLVEEAEELMREQGCLIGPLKQRQTQFNRAADAYFRDFIQYVAQEQRLVVLHDLDAFREIFHRFTRLDQPWRKDDATAPNQTNS